MWRGTSTWLWLGLGFTLLFLTEAVAADRTTSVCELEPCKCSSGILECDCSASSLVDITLRSAMFDSLSLSAIRVRHCRRLHVTSEAFSGLQGLQQVSIANVGTVSLEERSFSYPHSGESPHLLVNISHCHLPEIPSYCFRDLLREVLLSEVRVSLVRPYAFSSMYRLEKLAFHSVQLDVLEPQAFKKFTVELLSFVNTNITSLTKNTMINVGVNQEARFDRVRVNRIEPNALSIHSVKIFKVVQSVFGHLGRRAFNVLTKGDVSLHENTFEFIEKDAFLGFTVDQRYFIEAGKQDLIFENNTIVKFESSALTFNTSAFNPRLDWIMIKQQCNCEKIESWTTDIVYFTSDPLSRTAVPQVNAVMYCLSPALRRAKDFQTFVCQVTKSSLLVTILIVLGVTVLLCAVGGCIWHRRARNKSKRYIGVPTAKSALKLPGTSHNQMLVVPEGKTYRETELQVIVEHLDPIVSTEFIKERPDRETNETSKAL